MKRLLESITSFVSQFDRKRHSAAGGGTHGRKRQGRRLDSFLHHRGLRFEPMEERALLSVLQYCHVIYNPGADAPAVTTSAATVVSPADSTPLQSASPVGMTPQMIRTAYGINSITLGSITGTGAGQTIAIIDTYDAPNFVDSTDPNFNTSDLHLFDQQFGIADPPSFLKLNETGGTTMPSPSGGSGWSVEESLDVEWAHAIAPQANIILFEANGADDSDLITTAVNTARNWPGVTAITMSFGRSESSSDASEETVFTTPSGHAGVTFLASTGDSAAPGEFPAMSPNVVGVGGTSLTINSSTYAYVSESTWYDGGGGQSSYEAKPSYQNSVNSTSWRQIPDISFDADPNTGVAIRDSYDYGSSDPWIQVGGTSVASPCWAGLVAIGDQVRTSVGLATMDGPTQTLPLLYGMKSADFHDITTGSNGNPAKVGYDMATGIGTPVTNNLVPDFVPVSSKGYVTFSTHNYEIGTSATVTVGDLDLAGDPTCPVTLTSSAGDSETLSLSATGGGIFVGSIVTSSAAVTPGDGILETVAGGTITVTYHDANDGTGNPATVTDQATTFSVDHFTFTAISGPETAGVPFSVTASAYDSSNHLLSGYDGTATLTASDAAGALSVGPTSLTFTSGVWTGNVTVNAVDPTVTLSVTDPISGAGTSSTFATQAGPIAGFQSSTIASPQYKNVAFPVTLTAKDANGYTVTGFNGTATLSGLSGTGGTSSVLISEVYEYEPDAVEFTNVGSTTVNVGGWKVYLYDYTTWPNPLPVWTFPAGTTIPVGGVFQLVEYGTAPGSYPIFYTGWNISWVNQTSDDQVGVLLENASSQIVDFVCGADGIASAITNPTTIPTSQWQGSPIPGNTDITKTFSRVGTQDDNNASDWATQTASLGTLNPGLTIPWGTPVPITPTSATFVNGVWTGNVAVQQSGSSIYLHVDDGAGQTGDSNHFDVSNLPPVTPNLPTDVTVGAGTVNATLSIPAALSSDLVVAVTSSDPSRVTVPATVTIAAGTTSAPLPLTIIDNGLLYGPESIAIGTTATGYSPFSAPFTLHDNLSAALSVSLPASANENAGVLANAGTVTASAPAQNAVVVQLSSSDTTGLTVPATVTIPAGQTSATFNVTMVDDHVIDGNRPISVTAQMDTWTSGSATMTDIDDDGTLAVSLPASGWEGQTLTAAGTLTLGGTLTAPLTVSLVSSDSTELWVPATVTVPAGQRTATFTVTLLDNGLRTGPLSETVTATATTPYSVVNGSATMVVDDADVAYYTFSAIAGPQTAGVAFSATARAYDILGNPILVYNGTAALTAAGQSGALPVTPASATFVSGVWTGNVAVNGVDPSATLQLSNGSGATGTSGTFAVQPGPLTHFQWSTVPSTEYQTGPFPVSLTAEDANDYKVTGFNGTLSLGGQIPGATVTDGTGTSTSVIPLYTYYDQVRTQVIYEASELGGAGLITGLALDAQSLPGQTMNKFTIRMQPTTLSSYSTYAWQGSGWTTVYQSNQTISSTGWTTFNFTTPFNYDGVSNLMVDFSFNNPSSTGTYGYTYETSTTQTRELYYYTDNGYGDPLTWSGTSSPSPYTNSYIPNVRLSMGTPVTVAPTTATLVNGVWTGNLTVSQVAAGMALWASDGNGHGGSSNTFNVVARPFTVSLPANVTEGQSPATGTISVPVAPSADLTVDVACSDPNRLTVPSTVTIPAGQTSVAFSFGIVDSSLLQGPEAVTISAAAVGYVTGSGTVTVHDVNTAVLTVALPASADEDAGVLSAAGTITASAAPVKDILVQLTSSDTTGLSVPRTVILRAGQTTANFDVTMIDDHVIEGNRPITVTAQMDNWTPGAATMTDIDDDATLAVSLPASGWEGQTLAGAGTVRLGGTLTSPLVVSLTSADTTELAVPATVTIPAGQLTASFDVTLVENYRREGPESVAVTAAAAGLPTAGASMVVNDSDVDHFTFSVISGPQTAGVPFTVTARAYDVDNNLILDYNTAVTLTAYGQNGPLSLSTSSATFAAGVWTGSISVNAVDPNVTLQLNNGAGVVATSGAFATQAGPMTSLQWSTVASTEYQNTAFPATVTATDAHGYPVTSFSGTANVTGLVGTTTSVTVLSQPTPTSSSTTSAYTLGYSFTPSANLLVTDFVHYMGTKESLWTGTGTLLGSQTYSSTPGSWVDTPLTTPIQLTGGITYRVGVYLGSSANYYWRTDMSSTSPAGTIVQSYEGSGDAFPTSTDTIRWWFVDLRGNLGTYTPVTVSPTTVTLVGGVWSGNVTVQQAATGAHLHADDGAGQTGDSNTFNVSSLPRVTPVVPTDVTVGAGAVNATLSIPAALSTDLAVNLTSSDPSRVSVPATMTIPAGATSVTLPLTIIDNGLLYGPESIVIGTTATGYGPFSATFTLHDNLSAVLSVGLPASADENAGVLMGAGTVTISAPAQNAVVVQLSSSDTTGLTVPATVTIPAGQTSATFNVTMHDDHVIEGNRPISVTAQMDTWTSGSATMTDVDDDATLAVTLPASGWKGQTLWGAGSVQIGGTLTSNLTVNLTSADTTDLSVPSTVTIPAGQTTASFDVTLVSNGLRQGPETVAVTAAATGLTGGSTTMVVNDSNVDHFTFSTIASPQAGGTPFPLTITACDILGNPILVYNGTAALTALGHSGSLPITPGSLTFTNGVWAGNVTVNALDPNVVLRLDNGAGAFGASNSFAVQAGPVAGFQWSTLPSSEYQGVSFPVTVTATDAHGYTASGFNGMVGLSGYTAPTTVTDGTGTYTSSIPLDTYYYQVRDQVIYEASELGGAGLITGLALDVESLPGQTMNNFTLRMQPTTLSSYSSYAWQGTGWTTVYQSNQTISSTGWTTFNFTTPFKYDGVSNLMVDFSFNNSSSTGTYGYCYETSTTQTRALDYYTDNGYGDPLTWSGSSPSPYTNSYIPNIRLSVSPPVSIAPTTATLTAGVWTGTVAALQTASGVSLRADDGTGQTGSSGSFNVLPITLSLTAPANVTEGAAGLSGTLSLPAALSSDLPISLVSTDPARLAVPISVVIPAGRLSVSVPLTAVDTGVLEGPEQVTVSAFATGGLATNAAVTVHDYRTAVLSVSLPASADENAGVLAGAGTVTSSVPAQNAVVVQLSSSDTTGLTVPATVTIPAGQTSVSFDVTMHDDHVIEGNRPITVSALMDTWTPGSATLTDIDDDASLAVSLPASGWKGQTLTGAGSVTLGGALTTALTVSLSSSDSTELSVPATVTIPAGQRTATFTVTLLNDGRHTGPLTEQVTATGTGVSSGTATMVIDDSNVDHYAFTAIAGPMTAGVAFPATVTADDVDGNPILVYSGTAALTGAGQAGTLSVSPTSVTFASGTWTGNVTVNAVDPTVTLTASNGTGATGTSNAFATQSGPMASYQWSTVASPEYQNLPFPATVTAKDAHGYTVTGFSGTANLSGLVGTTTLVTILNQPTPTSTYTGGGYTDGFSFTPSSNLLVTDFLHYDGTKESLWTNAGVLLVSQAYSSTPGSWTDTPLATPIQLTGGTTYRIGVYEGTTTEYYRTDMSPTSPVGTILQDYTSLGDTFPSGVYSPRWDFADLRGNLGTYTSVPIAPTTATFVNGVWTGNITVQQTATGMYLAATDASMDTGSSNTFNVLTPLLTPTVPASATVGQGTVNGTITIPAALASDLVVSVTSSDPNRVTVPATVTIPAGATSAPLPLTIIDNGLLYGPESISISTAATGFTQGSATLTLHDDLSAALSLSLPASANENAGVLVNAGTVTSSAAAQNAVVVQLSSSDTTGLTVPATVTIPAGQTSANFNVTMVDDHVIDGNRPISVTAQMDNWTPGSATMTDLDVDGTLAVSLPASGWEGQTLTGAGTLTLGGTLSTPLTVALVSNDPSRLSVPATVTVPAGQTTAIFTVTLLNPGLHTGPVTDGITATATTPYSALTGSGTMVVDDSNLDHYKFTAIAGPETAGVAFPVTVTADDIQGNPILVYSGAASLTGAGQSGTLPVTPTSVTFASGTWTGNVTVGAADPAAVLTVTDSQGHTGSSNPFVVALVVPPTITSTAPSLTGGMLANGATTLAINFSKIVVGAGTASNYELQSVGPDGLLGTADDVIVPLSASYSGTTARLTFAALPQSVYRLTVSDAITDTGGTELDGNGNGNPGSNYVCDFVVLPPPTAGLSFGAPVVTSCGTTSGAQVVGDFTNNGVEDLVVSTPAGLTLMLGNGSGGFSSATVIPGSPTAVKGLAVGDFNNDGNLDLVANVANVGAEVFLGDGKGDFSAPVAYAVTGAAIATGDFNGDGITDLAVANYANSTISVLLGNGTGGFGAPTTYSTGGTGPRAIVAADFNGDGKLDLAVANYGSGNVGVLLGNGAGGFSAATVYSTGALIPQSLAVADFNGDGKPDLAVVNYSAINNTIAVLLGNGTGGFSSPTLYGTSNLSPWNVVAGDFAGNGKIDLAVTNAVSPGVISVLPGNGDGTFATPIALSSGGNNSESLSLGDFNGDGQPDLVVGNSTDGTVGVLLNAAGQSLDTLTTADGSAFDVQTKTFGAGQLVAGTNNPFHGLNRLKVGGADYQPAGNAAIDNGGQTVAVGTQTMAGLSVSRQVTVPNTGSQDFARTLDSFTNPTGSPITTAVTVVGDLGSGVNTTVFATSDGTGIVSPNDQWIGTDGGTGTPAVIQYLHGPAGLKPTSVAVTGSNISWTYNITVPAGQTVTLAYFTIVSTTPAAAIAAANALVTPGGFGGQAGAFLSTAQLSGLANFLFAPTATVILSEHSPSPTDVLTATATDSDVYGNPVTLTYVWTVNGTVKRTFSSTALTDTFNLSTLGAGDVGDTIVVSVTPNDGILAGTTVSDTATVVGVVPKVTNVVVGSDAWGSGFLSYLAAQNPNNVGGYSIPVGSGAQLLPLPWTNLDEIKVTFNENVTVAQADMMLVGVNTPSYNVAGGTFSYNAATFTATWTLPGDIPDDKLLLELNAGGSDPIEDASGNRLEGAWTNPTTTSSTGTSQYPSGNGVPGNFLFRFNVLPGDVNQDGYVEAVDGLLVRGALGSGAGAGNYSIFKDVNGDGYVLSSDGLLVLGQLGNSLPAANPVATAFPAADNSAARPSASPALRPLDVALLSVTEQLENGGLRTSLLDSPAASSPLVSEPGAIAPALGQTNQGEST